MEKDYRYYVYILTNKINTTLYIGVTSNLFVRGFQHKQKDFKNSFTAKYNINKLVYYEMHGDVHDAIEREKQLKKWNRDWKIGVIEKENKMWRDLFLDMLWLVYLL